MQTLKSDMKHLRRLQKRRDFLCVQGKGKKWVSQSLILQTIKHDKNADCDESREEPHMRVGFTVTKRVSKKAVIRNRIKRRLRAVAADTLSQHANSGYDYVLVGRIETLSKPYETMKKDLKWCLKRLELLKDAS
jgi:ribonuclease P protein component